jgi:hypothetical protein
MMTTNRRARAVSNFSLFGVLALMVLIFFVGMLAGALVTDAARRPHRPAIHAQPSPLTGTRAA